MHKLTNLQENWKRLSIKSNTKVKEESHISILEFQIRNLQAPKRSHTDFYVGKAKLEKILSSMKYEGFATSHQKSLPSNQKMFGMKSMGNYMVYTLIRFQNVSTLFVASSSKKHTLLTSFYSFSRLHWPDTTHFTNVSSQWCQ